MDEFIPNNTMNDRIDCMQVFTKVSQDPLQYLLSASNTERDRYERCFQNVIPRKDFERVLILAKNQMNNKVAMTKLVRNELVHMVNEISNSSGSESYKGENFYMDEDSYTGRSEDSYKGMSGKIYEDTDKDRNSMNIPGICNDYGKNGTTCINYIESNNRCDLIDDMTQQARNYYCEINTIKDKCETCIFLSPT